jgi:hypothetical protein
MSPAPNLFWFTPDPDIASWTSATTGPLCIPDGFKMMRGVVWSGSADRTNSALAVKGRRPDARDLTLLVNRNTLIVALRDRSQSARLPSIEAPLRRKTV